MKLFNWGTVATVLALTTIWFSSIFWVPKLQQVIAKNSEQCLTRSEKSEQADSAEICAGYFSRIGTTGDLFGASNALFSALALFAVAITLNNDVNARRQDRKPLLVWEFNNESSYLDKPRFDDHKALDLNLEFRLDNIGDPAVNIKIECKLVIDGKATELKLRQLTTPMASNQYKTIKIKHMLSNDQLIDFLGAISRNSDKLEFHVRATYHSMQNTKWGTEAIYQFRIEGNKSKIIPIIDNDLVGCAREWENSAAQVLNVELKTDTWKYKLERTGVWTDRLKEIMRKRLSVN